MKKLFGFVLAMSLTIGTSHVEARYLEADPLGLVDGPSVYGYAQQNPMRYVDPRGEYTEVIGWEPTGWGASSFGHASVTINGTSYSYGPSGMSVGPASEYYGRQNFRDGFGKPVRLTPNQEAALAMCLVQDQGEYSVLNNSCTDPIESCLCSVGVCIGDSYTLLGMMQRLRQHPSSYGIN